MITAICAVPPIRSLSVKPGRNVRTPHGVSAQTVRVFQISGLWFTRAPVNNRPHRVEPRAVKRRPSNQIYLNEPRSIAKARLLSGV